MPTHWLFQHTDKLSSLQAEKEGMTAVQQDAEQLIAALQPVYGLLLVRPVVLQAAVSWAGHIKCGHDSPLA